MKKDMSLYRYYLFIALILFSCSPSKGQLKEAQLKKENENLLISYNESTVVLKNILVDEASAYFKEGRNDNFYIIYEYYASFNKSMVIYSLHLNENTINISKVIHINYNDREGIPYGWIYFCNQEMSIKDVDYDKLTEIKSQMKYSRFFKGIDYRSVEIRSSMKMAKSSAIMEENGINLVIPLFYEDGNYIGEGVFQYKSNNWSDLSMNFSFSNLDGDYFFINEDIEAMNVVYFNNIAFYLEHGKNYKESIYTLKKILEKFPNRTVAYINLGDAYWGLKENSKAKKAYSKYISLMKANGKENKIPQRIFERIK